MKRTSLVLPASLHQRLVLAAQQEKKKISSIVRDMLDAALAEREQAQLATMYQALNTLEGVGEPGVTDASTAIDETLYGDRSGTERTYE